MARNFVLDTEGEMEKYAKRLMRDYDDLRILRNLNWIYVWKMGDPEYDNEKLMIAGQTRKLPARERDLYNKDVELRIHHDTWLDMLRDQKLRLIHHELMHVQVEVDEDMEVKRDDDGRILFHCISHDIVIKTFEKEIQLYGLPSQYRTVVKRMMNGQKESTRA